MEQNPKTTQKLNPRRRGFLATALAVPAVAVAALMARRAQVAPEAAAPEVEAPQSGYHETEHIRRYYSSVRY